MREQIDVLTELDELITSAEDQQDYCTETGPNKAMRAVVALREIRAAVAGLIGAAYEASGTLSHAYHTSLNGQLAEHAHTDYQRLDAALEAATLRNAKRQAKNAEWDAAQVRQWPQ